MHHKKSLILFLSIFFLSFSWHQNSFSQSKILNEGFANIVEELLPAVVNISTTQKIKDNTAKQLLEKLPQDRVFDNLKELLKVQSLQQKKVNSLGSGFIISKDGYIVTKYHVIENSEEIVANLYDGKKFKAKLVGFDKKTDLALLKISTSYDLKYVKFGDSSKSRIGDWVIVIGNPFGLGGSVSVGIISANSRSIISGQGSDFIQTDAAINRGNSGGPLFNIQGEVIGIATAIFSTSGGNIGIGFANTLESALPIIKELKDKGSVTRGWIGVAIQNVSSEMAKALEMKTPRGALVTNITKNGPAELAGLLPSDIIIKFDGKNIKEMKDLPHIVSETKVDKKVKVVVLRQGRAKTFKVVVKKMTDVTRKIPEEIEKEKTKASDHIIGLGLLNLDKNIKKEYKVEEDIKGVLIVDIKPGSSADKAGIRKNDIILSANQVPIKSIPSLKKTILKAIDNNKDAALLLIKRKDKQFSAVINLK
jgi:serine protease Do